MSFAIFKWLQRDWKTLLWTDVMFAVYLVVNANYQFSAISATLIVHGFNSTHEKPDNFINI